MLGLLLLCLGFGSLVTMPLTGALAARFGCRVVIVVAALLLGGMIPLLGMLESAPGLAAALLVFGGAMGTIDVAMNIQAVALEKAATRPIMSGLHGLFSLGGMLGAAGVSQLLGAGLTPLSAGLSVMALIYILIAVSGRGLLPLREAERGPLFAVPRGIVVLIGALCCIAFLAEGALLDWSALFLTEAHAIDPTHAGIGYAIFAVAMTLGRFGGDWIVKRLGRTRVLVLGGLLSAAGYGISVTAPGLAGTLAGFILIGIGISNIVPVLFTAAGTQTRMPAGLAIAAVTTLGYAGLLVGPALIGFLAEALSLAAALGIVGMSLLLVAATGRVITRA